MENVSDDFPQQKKLENLLPNFAGSSPPISPKTSPTSLWKSLVLTILVNSKQVTQVAKAHDFFDLCKVGQTTPNFSLLTLKVLGEEKPPPPYMREMGAICQILGPKWVYFRPFRTTFSMIVAQIVVFIVISPFPAF